MAFGAAELDPAAVTAAVFRLTSGESADKGVAITSDERDDFYRWWLFVRLPAGVPAADVLGAITGDPNSR